MEVYRIYACFHLKTAALCFQKKVYCAKCQMQFIGMTKILFIWSCFLLASQNNIEHGYFVARYYKIKLIHGMRKTRMSIYELWSLLKMRCRNRTLSFHISTPWNFEVRVVSPTNRTESEKQLFYNEKYGLSEYSSMQLSILYMALMEMSRCLLNAETDL